MKRRIIMSTIALLFTCIMGSNLTICAKSDNKIESSISKFQKITNCNAINVVIYDKGKISYYGNEESAYLYQIGSMTKAFTGLGVLKLVHEGKILPENKVSFYLPGFETYYEGEKSDITVNELLSQMSGFTNSEKDYPSAKKIGSIIFLVGLIIPRDRFTLTSASLDTNFRQYLEIFIPTVKNSRTVL